MSDFDPRVRDALVDLADHAPDGSDLWERTGQRIAQRRQRRAIAGAAGSALAVIAIAAGVVTIAREPNNVTAARLPVPTSTVPTSPPPTVAVERPVGTNERVVARLDGTIAVVDAQWRTKRQLARLATDRFIRRLAVSPDGRHVYALVDREPGPYGSDCADLIDVDLVAGEQHPVARARSFALSPDGARLALGLHDDGTTACRALDADGAAGVHIVQADTGEVEATWFGDQTGDSQVEALAWEANGSRLAAQVCTDTCRLMVFDVTPDALSPAEPFTPAPPADQTIAVVWGAGPLQALERCCEDEAEAADTRVRLRELDPANGTVLAETQVFDSWTATADTELLLLDGAWHALQRIGTPSSVDATLYRLDAEPPELVARGFSAIAVRSD